MSELSNAEQMEKLRRGEPGSYEFHLVQGESYEALEMMMIEARGLAVRYGGVWRHMPGTATVPDSFFIQIKPQKAAIDAK